MRTELQPAFVLHRRPFRNTSLLLEAFTREHGRIGLVARGASRPKARLRALLQPFTPVLLAWLEGAELATRSAAEERGLPYAMPSARLLSGFYLNELLLRLLTRHDPYPRLFDAYQDALLGLMQADTEEPLLRQFEKTLLDELGYGLQLGVDSVSGKPVQPDQRYHYNPQQGPWLAQGISHDWTISGRALLALQNDQLSEPQDLHEVKRLMRAAIGTHLDKPLRSREIMLNIQRRRHKADAV